MKTRRICLGSDLMYDVALDEGEIWHPAHVFFSLSEIVFLKLSGITKEIDGVECIPQSTLVNHMEAGKIPDHRAELEYLKRPR